ncbi:MAG: hypothetical protein MPJ22_00270, partial [Pirellulales bacterium]|nr:hypothetical protein [Pirellulales bacterium]
MIKCMNGRQVRAAKLINDHIPKSYIDDRKFSGIVFFVEPRNRLAVALRAYLRDSEIANLEAVGINLLHYTNWANGKLLAGIVDN